MYREKEVLVSNKGVWCTQSISPLKKSGGEKGRLRGGGEVHGSPFT